MARLRQWRRLAHPIGIGALCLVSLSGCTVSKAPFQYTPAYVPADEVPPPWKHASVIVVDQRSDRGLDEAVQPTIQNAVGEGLVADLRTAGFAAEASYTGQSVETPAADLLSRGIDAQLVATIQELRWEFVNYEQHQATEVAVGFIFGVAGALALATTDNKVNGHAKLDIRFTDLASALSFQKSFVGYCEKELPTHAAELPETKVRMSMCALDAAMLELRAELERFSTTLPPRGSDQ